MHTVFIVDPCTDEANALSCQLATHALQVHTLSRLDEAQHVLDRESFDVVVIGLGTTSHEVHRGMTLAAQVKKMAPMTVAILIARDPIVDVLVTPLSRQYGDYLVRGPQATQQALALIRRLLRWHALRHTKIVCTIGPASASEAMLERLIAAGMDVARLNFSHGDHAWHRTVCARIRRLSDRVAIMGDLQGPKLRVQRMAQDRSAFLERGTTFVLTSRPVEGTAHIVSLDYAALPCEVEPGDTLYLNDGLIELQVQEIRDGTDIVCQVITGGQLSSRKGINVPRGQLSARVPTARDEHDIALAAALAFDFLAVSFVTTAAEVQHVRRLVHQAGSDIPLISKIERAAALENFDSILQASDGIMVARGDLAVNIRPEEVPRHQKHMIQLCNQYGKPVICATQMLESMCDHPVPTRAEVSDIFNAILDGADAVMLSAESATGSYPIEAVQVMVRTMRNAEATMLPADPAVYDSIHAPMSEILGHGISTMVERCRQRGEPLAAILAVTREGHAARLIAKYRPGVPIIAATPDRRIARQLWLSRGITPMVLPVELTDPVLMIKTAVQQAMQAQHLTPEDIILTVSSSGAIPHGQPNFVGLFTVGELCTEAPSQSSQDASETPVTA